MNNYLADSGVFFKETSRRIQDNITDTEIIQLTFNLALGCERLLKGILFDINPTYVFIEPDFKHSLQTVYPDKIIPEAKPSKELASKPNSDVISFNNSLIRTQLVSKTTLSHKNVLFAISNARDIIAHCELRLLDKVKLKEILQRDFYTMLKSYSDELNIKKAHFFDGSHIKLSRISSSLQTDLNKKVKLLLETHLGKWKSLSGNESYVLEKDKITAEIFATGNKDKIVCPACKNNAIVYLKSIIEFDPIKMAEVQIGYEVKKLKCQYCKLESDDASILDNLGIRTRKTIQERIIKCARCDNEIQKDNATGMCEACDEHYGTEA